MSKTKFIPNLGESYFTITNGDIFETKWYDTKTDHKIFDLGMCFKTYNDAYEWCKEQILRSLS